MTLHKHGSGRPMRRAVGMIVVAVLAMTMVSIAEAGAQPTGSTAVQNTSVTSGRVYPQERARLLLSCWDRKRTPTVDLSSLKLSAVNADDRDNIQIPPMLERYYDPSPDQWWFDYVQDAPSEVTLTLYNRFPEKSDVDLYFHASVKCLPALRRRNATRNLLESDDLIAALQRVTEKSSNSESVYEELVFPVYGYRSDSEPYFGSLSSSSKRDAPTFTWNLGNDPLSLVSCNGQPTIWDAKTKVWYTRADGFDPPAGGLASAPVKLAFLPHTTSNAPDGAQPICADFDGDGRDSLMLATGGQFGDMWRGYGWTETFFAPTVSPDPKGYDTLSYQSTTTTSYVSETKPVGTVYPVARRLVPDQADTPGIILVNGGTSTVVYGAGRTTRKKTQTVSIPGSARPINGDVPHGADNRDGSVGLWSLTSSVVDTETIRAQTYIRPIARLSTPALAAATVKTRQAISSDLLRETTTQSLAVVTDQQSVAAVTKGVLTNEATQYPKNPNLGKCVDVWNGGTGTNQSCGSVATDPNFASAFRLIPTVNGAGDRTGWFQLVGSGPSVDECFGVNGGSGAIVNGSKTSLLPCLPGLSSSNGQAGTDWKVTTAQKYGTVAAGTDISTLPAPVPASVPLTFTAAGTSMVLDLDGSNTQAGTDVTVGVRNSTSLTQQWVFAHVDPAEVLHNAYWNTCDDTWPRVGTTYGTLQSCDTFADQQMASFFEEVPTQSGTDTFELQSTVLGSSGAPVCLGAPAGPSGAAPANGATPRLAGCDSLGFHEWQWTQQPDGLTGQLQLAGTSMCLDNQNGTYATHTNTVVVGTCNTAMASQVWDTVSHLTLARDSGAAATKSG